VPTLTVNEALHLTSVALDRDTVGAADCVVICANHASYDWARLADWASLIVDTRNAMKGVVNHRARVVPL
jgi:UDP-N-acetyl-D-glucosamine dehydrogenase